MYQYTSNITNVDNIINNQSNDCSKKSFSGVFLTKNSLIPFLKKLLTKYSFIFLIKTNLANSLFTYTTVVNTNKCL